MGAKRKIQSCRVVDTETTDLSTITGAAEGLKGVKVQVSICGDEEALQEFDEALGITPDDDE